MEEFVVCSCQTEGIYLVKHKTEPEVYISFFSHGINPKKMNFMSKVRYIWNLIKTGKPFEDQIVLDAAAVAKLKKLLNKI